MKKQNNRPSRSTVKGIDIDHSLPVETQLAQIVQRHTSASTFAKIKADVKANGEALAAKIGLSDEENPFRRKAPRSVKVANSPIYVQLTEEELRNVCARYASELANDMIGGNDENDFATTLRQWRRYSPKYVATTAAQYEALGFADARDDAEQFFEMHTESARTLEKLLGYLPAKETAQA